MFELCRDACEKGAQLRLLRVVELSEKLPFGLIAGPYSLLQDLLTGVGECDEVTAAVLVVGVTFDEAFRFEAVEQSDHGGAVDFETCSCLLLGLRFSCLQEQQNREFAAVDAQRVQVFAVDVLEVEGKRA